PLMKIPPANVPTRSPPAPWRGLATDRPEPVTRFSRPHDALSTTSACTRRDPPGRVLLTAGASESDGWQYNAGRPSSGSGMRSCARQAIDRAAGVSMRFRNPGAATRVAIALGTAGATILAARQVIPTVQTLAIGRGPIVEPPATKPNA